jgi:hypothetical protein
MIAGFFDRTTPMINFFTKAEGRVSRKEKYKAGYFSFLSVLSFLLSSG